MGTGDMSRRTHYSSGYTHWSTSLRDSVGTAIPIDVYSRLSQGIVIHKANLLDETEGWQ
jgi:hypothetical protein